MEEHYEEKTAEVFFIRLTLIRFLRAIKGILESLDLQALWKLNNPDVSVVSF